MSLIQNANWVETGFAGPDLILIDVDTALVLDVLPGALPAPID